MRIRLPPSNPTLSRHQQNPLPPHPEQTASLLSFISFTFLDSIIFKAYRLPRLPYEELPVLADYDHADVLVEKSFPYLNPALKPVKGRHIFFGLLWVYRKSFPTRCLAITPDYTH